MKNYFTIIIIITLSTIISILLWDLISFDTNREVLSGNLIKHHTAWNPLNDPIRFIIFLSIPYLSLVFYYHKKDKVFIKNIKSIFLYDNILKTNFNESINKELNFYTFIIFILLAFEFFLIDFKSLNHNLDFFHEGMWLSASQNLKLTGEFWASSYVVRGLFADFYPYFVWKFTGLETIGVTRLFNLMIIFLNKVLIVLILRKFCLLTNFNIQRSVIFFLSLSILLLSLQGYFAPIFLQRSFLLLVFIYVFLSFISNYKKKSFYVIFFGLFSSLTFLWYIDIAIYINFILIIFLIFFLIRREANFFILSASIFFGWLTIFLLFPRAEFYQFLNNTYLILTTLNWIHGIQFPTPFVSMDSRSTKAIILFLITGFLLIKEVNNIGLTRSSSIKSLISTVFLFFVSLIYFNYALGRSDGPHIRSATSMIYLPFFILVLPYLMNNPLFVFIEKKRSIFKFSKLCLVTVLISLTIFFNKKYENKKIVNILNFPNSIEKLINYKDNSFINEDYQDLVKFFNEITIMDECISIFTNEVALFYLIKKKSCSKYYFMWTATPNVIQNKIISDLSYKKPSFIIYKSNVDPFFNSQKKVNKVNNYIKNNYDFHTNFKKWEILKINSK